MVLKQRYRWGYRTLVAEVSDSIHLRRSVRQDGSMGRWAPDLTHLERDAIRHAKTKGRSVRDIVELAAKGRLWYRDWVPAFEVSETTVNDLVLEAQPPNGDADEPARRLPRPEPRWQTSAPSSSSRSARIKAVPDPTPRHLSAMRIAMHTLDDLDGGTARDARTALRGIRRPRRATANHPRSWRTCSSKIREEGSDP